MSKRYLIVDIYRHERGYDCTLNGVTSPARKLRMLIEHPQGFITEVGPNDMVLDIVRRVICGKPYVHAKPRGETRHCMFGGNYIESSDARFREFNQYPIPVHDRIEERPGA